MALSYYSNWGAFQPLNPESMNGFGPAAQMEQLITPEQELLLGFMNDVNFVFPEACNNNIDHLFQQQSILEEDNSFFFCSPTESSDSLLPSFPSNGVNLPTDNYLSDTIPTEPIFQLDEAFNHPKRQRPSDNYEDIIYAASDAQFNPPLFNGLLPNNPPPPCFNFQEYYPPLPDFPTGPPDYSGGSCQQSMKKLSAQSIAARQRRRKITEKTQELGKLIPGGQKMNTAEMFQSAYKYIKFLQAQVGVLEFIGSGSTHERGNPSENGEGILSEEMQDLLESALVQEKLYSTEKCLVPQKLVYELNNNEKILKSKPQLLKDVRQLLSIGEN